MGVPIWGGAMLRGMDKWAPRRRGIGKARSMNMVRDSRLKSRTAQATAAQRYPGWCLDREGQLYTCMHVYCISCL